MIRSVDQGSTHSRKLSIRKRVASRVSVIVKSTEDWYENKIRDREVQIVGFNYLVPKAHWNYSSQYFIAISRIVPSSFRGAPSL